MKHRRRKAAAPRKPVTADDLRHATQSAVDQTREAAKQVFEHIKATHARAEKRVE